MDFSEKPKITQAAKENIIAALNKRYADRALPPLGTAIDELYCVIVCPVCGQKTLDNYDVCRFCGWEYDGRPEECYSSANGATLAEYRKEFYRLKKEMEK